MLESFYGPDYSELGPLLNNLGLTLLRLGDLEGARRSYERATRLLERAHGPDHSYVASSRAGFAQTLLPGTEEARRETERVLNTGLALYTPTPGPGAELLQRAVVLARSPRVPPAEVTHALSEAARVAERAEDTTNAMRALLLLGAFMGSHGAWEAAREHLEQALQLARRSDSPVHIAEAHRLLGDANLHGSMYEDARLHYAEAIRRYDDLALKLKAAKTRLLLLTMLIQLGRARDVEQLVSPLRAAVEEGLFTNPQERTNAERALKLVESLNLTLNADNSR